VVNLIATGGQEETDQGALRAARAAGIAIGGFAPKGWATEAGAAPWLAEFGLVECEMGRE
jgi:Circularly permutated YpsA SLOG family